MTTKGLPRVSIIIVNYNGKRYLDDCLGSLAGLEYPEEKRETVVVDNASSDGSVEHVQERFPWVKVIRCAGNGGFAAGNNEGIAATDGEFVALLNNDTEVDKGWLSELVRVAMEDPRVGIVTSKLLFKDRPDTINNAGSMVYSDGWGADRGFGEKDRGQFDRVEEVFCACGASMLLRRKMLEEIGLFDRDFFCYYEDTDLSWRARLKGWKVVYNYRSRVYHVHAGTSVEWSPMFTFFVLRNRLFMLLKDAAMGMFLGSLALFIRNTAYSLWLRTFRRGKNVGPFYSVKIRLKVMGSLLKHLPRLMADRRAIRSGAACGDSEITGWIKPRGGR